MSVPGSAHGERKMQATKDAIRYTIHQWHGWIKKYGEITDGVFK